MKPVSLKLASVLLLGVLPPGAAAETAYVTDNLRLGLHQAPDTSDRPFRTLESGQELEIVSRDRNYASVQLPDGVQGHVKAAYLVFDKPAKLVVEEVRDAHAALQADMEQMRNDFAAPAETIAGLEAAVREKDALLATSTSRQAELDAQIAGFEERYAAYRFAVPYQWVAGVMLVCLLAGFLVGLWWIDYRSRKRHGGVRIY